MLDKLYRPVRGERSIDRRLTQKRWERPEYYKTIWWPYHLWLDYAWPKPWDKSKVYASHDWIVSVLSDPKWFGNYVTIDWWEYVTYYAHLSAISVKSWDKVMLNQEIWTMWNTWNSSAVHLHFWLRMKDRSAWYKWWVDPTQYITNWLVQEELPLVKEWVWSGDRKNEPATRLEVAIMLERLFNLIKQ